MPPAAANYVAFSGGGEALAALLGGQLTAGVSGYGEFAPSIAAGQLRVLATSAPVREPLVDAPTLRESGVPLDLANWRAVVAPPGISDAERDALTARVQRMTRSAAWRETLQRTGWTDAYLDGAAFRQFLLAEQARVDAVLSRLAAQDDTRGPVRWQPTARTAPAIALAACGLLLAARWWQRRRPAAATSAPRERTAPRRRAARRADAAGHRAAAGRLRADRGRGLRRLDTGPRQPPPASRSRLSARCSPARSPRSSPGDSACRCRWAARRHDRVRRALGGLPAGAHPGAPRLGPGRGHARHRGRRAARHRPGAHRRAAAARHLRPRADGGVHHVRGHLLRRDVRRLDDVDPAQHARRERHDRHRDRRPPDGPARPGRRGAGHRRHRQLRRRHARHAGPHRERAVDGAAGAGVRSRRLLRAHRARLRRHRHAARRVAGRRAAQPRRRRRARPDRHRSAERRGPPHLRRAVPARRPRPDDRRDRPVRRRRDAGAGRGSARPGHA